MGHIYQRGKRKNWYLKYYLNGRQILKSLGTGNYRVARERAKLLEAGQNRTDKQKPPANRILLSDALEEFCTYLQTIRTMKSYKNEYSRLRRIFGNVCPLLEYKIKSKSSPPSILIKAKYIDGVTTDKIRNLFDMLRKKNISPTTLLRYRDILNKLFVWASERFSYDKNPVKPIPRRIISAPIIRFLEKDEIRKQLHTLKKNPRIYYMVAVCIYAGLRREEVVWLTHDDVDLNLRMVYVRAKKIDGEHWQPKTKKNRAVPISKRLFRILKTYKASKENPWYFPSNSNHMRPDTFSHYLAEINRMAGLDWSCLDFRHTFGSQLAKRGISLFKISELMGNSPEVCRQHYAAIRTEHLHEDVEF
jgi:integrase